MEVADREETNHKYRPLALCVFKSGSFENHGWYSREPAEPDCLADGIARLPLCMRQRGLYLLFSEHRCHPLFAGLL